MPNFPTRATPVDWLLRRVDTVPRAADLQGSEASSGAVALTRQHRAFESGTGRRTRYPAAAPQVLADWYLVPLLGAEVMRLAEASVEASLLTAHAVRRDMPRAAPQAAA